MASRNSLSTGGYFMIIRKSGHIKNGLYYLLHPEFPVFLLDRPEPVIFDAGLSCAGKLYAQEIKSVLGDRQPSILFLTHSHWDHCGSVSTLKKAFPDMKVAASPLAANVVKRPNALALIQELNKGAAHEIRLVVPGVESLLVNEPFRPFEVDIELQDQQVFDLGAGTTLEVMATPGHTQDHHSFYLPHDKILIAGEAAGVYYGPQTISPEFVSDYDAYVSSLQRLARLPVDVYSQGHYACMTGEEEIKAYFERSLRETIRFKERVFELLDEEEGSIERVVQRVKAEQFYGNKELKQPEVTYTLNLRARVNNLAAKKRQQSA
jgi:glyoxylase-like metal-dependent hydrolase (beta-lactamase superfamily II)